MCATGDGNHDDPGVTVYPPATGTGRKRSYVTPIDDSGRNGPQCYHTGELAWGYLTEWGEGNGTKCYHTGELAWGYLTWGEMGKGEMRTGKMRTGESRRQRELVRRLVF